MVKQNNRNDSAEMELLTFSRGDLRWERSLARTIDMALLSSLPLPFYSGGGG